MAVLQERTLFVDSYFQQRLPAPEELRGLSLDEVSTHYSTAGLYVRLQDGLDCNGLNTPAVQAGIELGLTVHAGDSRTYQPYVDHLLEVTIRVVEDYDIRDEATVAACPAHDCLEDHASDVVEYFGGDWDEGDDEAVVMDMGRRLIAQHIGQKTASLVWLVTNPPLPEGTDRAAANTAYAERLRLRIMPSPSGRVLKLGDFDRNAVNNHLTAEPLRQLLDTKYIDLYDVHERGLFLPDSLITDSKQIETAQRRLQGGRARAAARIASLRQSAAA
jgi:hypothetical protein